MAVAGWFIDGRVDLVPNSPNTIPVPIEGGAAIVSAAVRRLVIDAEADLAVVDLANSMRPILPPYSIMSSLVEALNESERRPATIVFLVNSQFWDADPAFQPVRSLIESGAATVLSDDGALRGQRHSTKEFDSAAYKLALAAARTSPLALFQAKLVRQHGHFKRYRDGGTHDHCVSFFFDGRNCINELTELITTHFSNEERSDLERELLFHAPNSPWLSGAAEAASIRLGLPLRRIHLEAGDLGTGGRISDSPAVLVPMCDTGRTLETIIRALRTINNRCVPSILSMLSTEGFDRPSGRRVLYVDGSACEINYLLRVDQPHHALGECRQCRMGIPASISEHPGHDDPEITAFAMWNMILEAGLKVEEDVPTESRPSLGLVPNFPEVIRRNGPYLAAKMHAELGRMKGKLPRNPIILCPDEKGARALSDALTNVYKYTVVRVPGPSLRKGKYDFSDEEKAEDWFVQLSSLRGTEGTDVIAMDEFNASTSTRFSLKRLAASFGLGIKCYVSLFDFNPTARTIMDARVYSLYSIDWLKGYTGTLRRDL